jgi:flagellar hook assembly protein FlgD/cell division septation protein DedD
LPLPGAGGVGSNTEGTPCFLTIQSTTFENNSPEGLAVDHNGTIYVADTGNGRIQAIKTDGSFDKEFRKGTDGVPDNARLTRIALGTDQIFVVDEANNTVHLLDYSFNYLASYQGNPSSPFTSLHNISVPAPANGQLSACKAITVENNRVQLFQIGMDVVDFRAEPSVFYPPASESNQAMIKYTLTEYGLVRISIYDSNNNLVRQLFSQNYQGIGKHTMAWDGKDDAGNYLPGGQYNAEIAARDMNGYEDHAIHVTYRDCPIVIHEPPVVTISSINPNVIYTGKTSEVDYSLSKTGYVKAEVINGAGQVVRTLKSDSLEQDGQNVIWNGAGDASLTDGWYFIRIQAKDSDGYWGLAKSIKVALANAPPAVTLESPANQTFGLDAHIHGSVNGFLLSNYKLEYSTDSIQWTTIVQQTIDSTGTTQTVSGELAKWNTGALAATETTHYKIRLTGTNLAGLASPSQPMDVLVDNIPPRVPVLFAFPDYISPAPAAAGSTQNASAVNYQISEANPDSIILKFIDKYAKEEKVNTLTSLSGAVAWDGINQGVVSEDGTIFCRLTVQDKGGNQTTAECRLVIDTNRYPENFAVTYTTPLSLDTGTMTSSLFAQKLSWSADNNQIAYTRYDQENTTNIYFKNLATGSVTRYTNSNGAAVNAYPDFEPNGRRIIFTLNDNLYIQNLGDSSMTLLTAGQWGRWSPDGTKIAFMKSVGYVHHVYVINVDGTGLKDLDTGYFPSWSPDSKWIYYSGYSDPVDQYTYKITPAGVKASNSFYNQIFEELSPDGNVRTYLDGNYKVTACTLDNQTHTIQNPPPVWQSITWASDGKRLAYIGYNGTAYVANVSRPDRFSNLCAVLLTPKAGDVDIKGTAADLNFAGYELSWGKAVDTYSPPAVWTLLKSSGSPVCEATLGEWNIAGLPAGYYWLKLRVWDKAMNVREIMKTVPIGLLGPDMISDVTISPNQITVNGKTSTASTLSYVLHGAVSGMTIRVANTSGVFVKTLSIPADTGSYPKTYSLIWNGTDNSGAVVPAGAYTIHVQGQAQGYNIDKEISIQAVAGVAAVNCVLTQPANGTLYTGNVTLQGTASGGSFKAYTLEVVNSSGEHLTVDQGTIPRDNYSFSVWTPVNDGTYTANLIVYPQSGSPVTSSAAFTVDRTPPVSSLVITTPAYQITGTNYVGVFNSISIVSQDLTGIKGIQYTLDGVGGTYSVPLTNLKPGAHTFTYFATDQLGNQETSKTFSLVVNTLRPTTVISIGAPCYVDSAIRYINHDTSISLSAQEQGTTAVPVTQTLWALKSSGGINWLPYTQPFKLSVTGDQQILYYSQDATGNTEACQMTGILRFDNDPPATTLTTVGSGLVTGPQGQYYSTSAVMYTLQATDAGSQVDNIEYQICPSGTTTTGWNEFSGTDKIILTHEGLNSIRYYSLDHVGNSEAAQSYSVVIDNTPPRVVFNGMQEGGTCLIPFTPSITIKDANLKDKQVLLDGQIYSEGSSVLSVGQHYLAVTACDWAGNSTQASIHFLLAAATATATATPTGTVTATPTASPTNTPTPTRTASATPSTTATMISTKTPTPTPTTTQSATSTPRCFHIPGQFRAFPNPAKGKVNFILKLEQDAWVKVEIYNLFGEKAAMIHEFKSASDEAILEWVCHGIAPGIYICRISLKGEDGRIRMLGKLKVAIVR